MTEGRIVSAELRAYAEHLARQLLVRTAERDALARKVMRLGDGHKPTQQDGAVAGAAQSGQDPGRLA